MAIFHLHVKNISRRLGRSVVAAAAYRAGETLVNEAEERLSAFGGRRDVLHNEIVLPADAPQWMADRTRLWNAVEAAEIRKDARLAKEIEVALPREMSKAEWLMLARQLATAYAAQGFVADFAIHDDGTAHNPHVHVLLTTRHVNQAGFGGKIRSADGRQFVEEARVLWSRLANEALAKAGLGLSIDPRSHHQAGIERAPTEHRGPNAEERQSRRDNMALSRLFPLKVKPETRDDRARMLEDWPASQMARASASEQDLPMLAPVDGLISQAQLDEAQERMLAEVESQPFDMSQSRRWKEGADAPITAEPERDRPFVSRRWESDAERKRSIEPDYDTLRDEPRRDQTRD